MLRCIQGGLACIILVSGVLGGMWCITKLGANGELGYLTGVLWGWYLCLVAQRLRGKL